MTKMRRLVYFLIIGLLVIMAGGCFYTAEVTVKLSGFPSDHAQYQVMVRPLIKNVSGYTFVDSYHFKDIPATGTLEQKITVTGNVRYIVVCLDEGEGGEANRRYIYEFPYDPEKNEYSTNYWFKYPDYYQNQFEYGISNDFLQDRQLDFSESLSFSTIPYYVYKLTGVQGKSIKLNFDITKGSARYKFGESLQELTAGNTQPITYDSFEVIRNYGGEDLYLVFTPGDYTKETTYAIAVTEVANQ